MRTCFFKAVTIAICGLMAENVTAQQLKGRVVEIGQNGKTGLPGASVYWTNAMTGGVATDADGNFTINRKGTGRLVVSFVGYTSDTIDVPANQNYVEAVLSSGEMLEEVKIVKRGQTTIMNRKNPVIEQVITGEELCKAACCNLGESFTTNASVDVSYADAVTGAKQIQLLGLNGKYVQMMTENMPNFRGLAVLYGLNYVPGPWMSAISISKGVGSVTNGYEAIAGQISVDYKKPANTEKFYVNLYGSDEEMMEFNMNGNIHINSKWSTALLLHFDRMNKNHVMHQNGFLDMPKSTQYNAMNRWAYKTDTWFLQFGGKILDEERLGGQRNFKKSQRGHIGGTNAYGSYIDTRRYEGFLKIGYLMPQYENTSMALLLNYTNHHHDATYGGYDYDAKQQTLFANYIYQSIFGTNPNQKFSAGTSFSYDRYDETFSDYSRTPDGLVKNAAVNPVREDRSGGVFFQYTGDFWDKLTIMAGLRYDYHNRADGFVTPRFHISYRPDDMTTLKFSGGQGRRYAAIIAENAYLLSSGKMAYLNGLRLSENTRALNDLDMEEAWNFGVLANRKFLVMDRVLSINLDYYRTDFSHRVVADNETIDGQIRFYNQDGNSYSNCYQAEIKYELIPRLDVLLAYRYTDSKVTYSTPTGRERIRTPLQSRYKGLINLSYYTNMKKWQFDFTTQFNGPGRLPGGNSQFQSYRMVNAQVTKFFRRGSIYAGCENIGDFMQKHPIIAADDPWSEDFDASRIWGPLHGRKFYIGVRFGLDRE